MRDADDFRIFSLPAWVDWATLREVVEQMGRTHPTRGWVLDFEETRHIRFQALRQFVGLVRRLEPLPRPIVLAGLNPYCQRILQFVLIPRDWDLLFEAAGDWVLAVPRGTCASEFAAVGSGRTPEGAAYVAFSVLSPN